MRGASMSSMRSSNAMAVSPQYTPLIRKCSVATYSNVSVSCTSRVRVRALRSAGAQMPHTLATRVGMTYPV